MNFLKSSESFLKKCTCEMDRVEAARQPGGGGYYIHTTSIWCDHNIKFKIDSISADGALYQLDDFWAWARFNPRIQSFWVYGSFMTGHGLSLDEAVKSYHKDFHDHYRWGIIKEHMPDVFKKIISIKESVV